MQQKLDITIIGGGAAGLVAAISALRTGKTDSVCVLERLSRAGKKLLVTGNGRCNLSNRALAPENYHGTVDVKPLLERVPALDSFFGSLGLLLRDDGEGRLYPFSNSAATVRETLVSFAQRLGAQIRLEQSVSEIIPTKGGFMLKTADGVIISRKVILACGGRSGAVHGSDGSGLELASSLGLSVTETAPALCAILTEKPLVKPLDGLRAKCEVSLVEGGKVIGVQRGEVQFTKTSLSGICVFNLSGTVNPNKQQCLRLDLMPDFTKEEVEKLFEAYRKTRRDFPPNERLAGVFSQRLADYLHSRSNGKPERLVKSLEFSVCGLPDFSQSQVTKGGVHGNEINDSFAALKHDGLYLIGEILDVYGDCGGYNLHFAFGSGLVAGENAARSLYD